MPINNNDYRVKTINQIDGAEKFHCDRKTKMLIKGYDRYNNSSKSYNGKSFK